MGRLFQRLAAVSAVLVLFLAVDHQVGAQMLLRAFEAIIHLAGEPLPASHGVLSEHEIEEIDRLPAQKQAERLLQRALNHYEGASGLIEDRVDEWRGQLEFSKQMETLTWAAYNSSDLRVRAASVEVSLAAYGIEKTADDADHFIRLLEQDKVDRPYRLWVLGLLANRGVEPERVFRTLESYLADPEEETRKWAVNSIAMLGNDETIPLLLDVFRFDTSLVVKERAACSLAESGMLTREQRQQAVPEFLRFMDDPALEPEARRWSFQALRDITRQSISNDASGWRNWAASEGY